MKVDYNWGAVGIVINVSNNQASYNLITNCWCLSDAWGADGGAFELDDENYAKDNITIDHNITLNNEGFLETIGFGRVITNVGIYYNYSNDTEKFLGLRDCENWLIYNNTIIRTLPLRGFYDNAVTWWVNDVYPQSTTWINNIIVMGNGIAGVFSDISGQVHHNNIFWSVDGTNANPIGEAAGPKDIIANPGFVNYGNGDLHLISNSPAIKNGANVAFNLDLDGNTIPATPDCGAFQYNSSAPTVTLPVISPAPGTYNSSQLISISCATPNSWIFYTTDGSNPGTSQTRITYSGPFTIVADTTVKAYAIAAGSFQSGFATATYAISASVVADSIADFSLTQGAKGWSYGYFAGGTTFTLDAANDGASWWQGIDTQCWIGQSFQIPGAKQPCVRRWTSTYTGSANIIGALKKSNVSGGYGVMGQIYVNGVQVWAQEVVYNDLIGVAFNVPLVVKTGDTIDFIVNSNVNGRGEIYSNVDDQSVFTAQILAARVLTPVIASPPSAKGSVGASFNYQITASNNPTSFSAIGLPMGLSFNPTTGVISGIPKAAGTSTIVLSASNASGTGPISNLELTITAMVTGKLNLIISTAATTGTVNLTTLGTADWRHWGATGVSSNYNIGNLISEYSVLTKGSAVAYYTNNLTPFSWTNGHPIGSNTGTTTGVYTSGINNGFQVVLTSSATLRTATIYVGGWQSSGQLTASFADGSAAPITSALASSSSGQYFQVYTISYSSSVASPLMLKWTQTAGTGNVTLNAIYVK